MFSISGSSAFERSAAVPAGQSSATRDAALRRNFRPELKAIRTQLDTTHLSDPLTGLIDTWLSNFTEALNISNNFEEMFRKHISQLHLLLRDPFGIPLSRGSLQYSDNRVYAPRSIELHHLHPNIDTRNRSPLDSNNPAPFTVIGPHAHVQFLLEWMERHHLLEQQPEMDRVFHDLLHRRNSGAPPPVGRVSDVAARRLSAPRMMTLDDLRRRDEKEHPSHPAQDAHSSMRPRSMTLAELHQRDALEAASSAPNPSLPSALPAQAPIPTQEPLPASAPPAEPIQEPAPAPPQPAVPNLERMARIAQLRANVFRRQAEEAEERKRAEEEEGRQDEFEGRLDNVLGGIRADMIEGFAQINGEAIAFRDEGLAELARLRIIDDQQWNELEQMQNNNQERINDLENRNGDLSRGITELQNGIRRIADMNKQTALLNLQLEQRVNRLEIEARRKLKSDWSSVWTALAVLGACALTTFVISGALASMGSTVQASVISTDKGLWTSLSYHF